MLQSLKRWLNASFQRWMVSNFEKAGSRFNMLSCFFFILCLVALCSIPLLCTLMCLGTMVGHDIFSLMSCTDHEPNQNLDRRKKDETFWMFYVETDQRWKNNFLKQLMAIAPCVLKHVPAHVWRCLCITSCCFDILTSELSMHLGGVWLLSPYTGNLRYLSNLFLPRQISV